MNLAARKEEGRSKESEVQAHAEEMKVKSNRRSTLGEDSEELMKKRLKSAKAQSSSETRKAASHEELHTRPKHDSEDELVQQHTSDLVQ